MTITLANIRTNEEPVDITHLIDETATFELTDENERGDFETVTGDVSVRLSDLDDSLRLRFVAAQPTDRFKMCIYDDSMVCRFRGYVTPATAEYDVHDQKITLTAINVMKTFWENAAQIYPYEAAFESTNDTTFPLTDLLEEYTDALLYPSVALSVSVPTTFKLRGNKLAWEGYGLADWVPTLYLADYTVLDSARLCNLGRSISLKDVFQSVMRRFNHEFVYRPQIDAVVLVPRKLPMSPATTDESADVLDSEPISIAFVDKSAYDYIRTYGPYSASPAPKILFTSYVSAFQGIPLSELDWTDFVYVVFGEYADGSFSGASGLSVLSFPDPDLFPVPWGDYFTVSLSIPKLNAPVVRRHVYRGFMDDLHFFRGDLYHIATVEGNDEIGSAGDAWFKLALSAHINELEDAGFIHPTLSPDVISRQATLVRYDYATKQWSAGYSAIDGTTMPQGKIFDDRAPLKFRNSEGNDIESTPQQEAIFFGQAEDLSIAGIDSTSKRIRDWFQNLFLPERRVSLSMRGISHALGDGKLLKQIRGLDESHLFVRRARVDLLHEVSHLELISDLTHRYIEVTT